MQSTELQRTQFTFYRSYLDAVLKLPKSRQFEALEAIIQYALYGTTPQSMSPKVEAVFTAIRPNLDVARLKALHRMKAGVGADHFPGGSM